ncbi:hypothetical protein D8674_013115 [Pyrus ussuriensis x Pyrus communis]|uniref:Transmembrane protein n=1 Tax=Pyrus ussuriensis x Pyrus communis TaxID=2448454 RepID=A0A5N5GNR9_9ROSA|nr:hypothetical protein D8674_013115 [Pyrus ussuriensis x Pyrus communis]
MKLTIFNEFRDLFYREKSFKYLLFIATVSILCVHPYSDLQPYNLLRLCVDSSGFTGSGVSNTTTFFLLSAFFGSVVRGSPRNSSRQLASLVWLLAILTVWLCTSSRLEFDVAFGEVLLDCARGIGRLGMTSGGEGDGRSF